VGLKFVTPETGALKLRDIPATERVFVRRIALQLAKREKPLLKAPLALWGVVLGGGVGVWLCCSVVGPSFRVQNTILQQGLYLAEVLVPSGICGAIGLKIMDYFAGRHLETVLRVFRELQDGNGPVGDENPGHLHSNQKGR